MGWVRSFVGGLILIILLLSLAASFTGYLLYTHSSCSPVTNSDTSSKSVNANQVGKSPQFGLVPAPDSPLALSSSNLVPTPLANLSSGQDTAPPDLTAYAFWEEVRSSATQAYEQIIPQTVIGFYNSSVEWKTWVAQNLPESESWLTPGFIVEAQNQIAAVDPMSRGNNESASAVQQKVDDFAASAAGVTLASLDFISFNGLSGFRTLFETDNPVLAACQTLPGQLGQLYRSSFDPSVPQAVRADYLGRALAITSVMLLIGGASHFADHFQTALDGVGLGNAWATVKPYLGDIASKASAGAATATFGILQTLAGRFPQDSAWVTGLTADRIDSMVQVLKDKGTPDNVIKSDIQKVAQAAKSSSAEDGAADSADDIAYQQGGWLQMAVNKQNQLTRYADSTGRTERITVSWLQDNVPGFDPTQAQFIQIRYRDQGVTVFNHYSGPKGGSDMVDGNKQWTPTVPSGVASSGTDVYVQIELLTPQAFAANMPLLEFNGLGLNARWMTVASRFTSYTLTGDELRIGVTQASAGLFPIPDYEIDGMQTSLYWDGKVTSLSFRVVDAFGQSTEMRLVYNGFSNPHLRIVTGQSDFAEVLLVSSDSVSLKFLYDTGPDKSSTATIFVKTPSQLWSLSDEVLGDPGYLASGGTAVYQINNVVPARTLERTIANVGTDYDKGVLGAEIAYTVGTQKLGLRDLIMNEPSEGGADLNTADRTTFIQARLVDLNEASQVDIVPLIQDQVHQMMYSLHQDFANNPRTAKIGYVIISYIDIDHSIKTIIIQVPNQ